MRVKALIEYLEGFDPLSRVLMSSDSEGNFYRELAAVEKSLYTTDDNYHYDLINPEDEEEYREDGESFDSGVVLWP